MKRTRASTIGKEKTIHENENELSHSSGTTIEYVSPNSPENESPGNECILLIILVSYCYKF